MPAKGSKPAGTAPHPPALVGSFTLTCLALKPTPPSQRKATHSTGILGFRNRAEAGLLREGTGEVLLENSLPDLNILKLSKELLRKETEL